MLPDPRGFDSIIDVIEDAATRWAGREQMALRTDDGLHLQWTAADISYHSKLVAWRLKRLGLERHATCIMSVDEFLPAVGQGAIGIEARESTARVREILARIDHADTFTAVACERAFLAALDGSSR